MNTLNGLTRRQLAKYSMLLGAAPGVTPASTGPAPRKSVRDSLWLWSHIEGSYNNHYRLPGVSRITPVEAAFYMSIPNVFMIQLNGKPKPEALSQYAIPFRPLREVAWSVVDPQDVTPTHEREAVLDLAFKTGNIRGVVMDDFFVRRKSWSEGQVADLSLEELEDLKGRLKRGSKRLDLWVVLYELQLQESIEPLMPYLELCDVVQFWTWHAKHLTELPANFDRLGKLLPDVRKAMGLFMWDFGDQKPIELSAMQQQCETGLRWLHQNRIEAMVFCGSWLCDRGLEAVEWTRQWIQRVGSQKVPTRKRG